MDTWQLVSIAGSSLVVVIGVLWKIITSVWKENKERLKRYEQREQEWHDEMRSLSNQVSNMEGRREGEKKGVELVVSAVIEDIRASRREFQDKQ